MAVKKAKTVKEELDEKVDVVADVTEDTETSKTDETEIDVVEETASDVEVDEPTDIEVEVDEPSNSDVEVSVEDTVVNTAKKPNGNVKIRMRVDHKCCIAMERYDLKADKVYTVPENVKNILNKAGLLSPL